MSVNLTAVSASVVEPADSHWPLVCRNKRSYGNCRKQKLFSIAALELKVPLS